MKDFKKIFVLSILFIAFFVNNAKSQVENLESLSPAQLKNFGKNAERLGDYYTAIVFYERFYKLNPGNQKLNYQLAELYRNTRNYTEAGNMYEVVSKKAYNKFPLSLFYYAQMLKSQGKYDEAIEAFNKFKKKYKNEKDSKTYSSIVRSEIEGCEKAKEILNNPLKVNIERLNNSINGPHVELSPIPHGRNKLIYASLKMDSTIYFSRNNSNEIIPVRQFYQAKRSGNDWMGESLLDGPFNQPGVETGNGAYSVDGSRFYFTRCGKNWQGKTICDLYVSQQEKGKWLEPVKIEYGVNDPNYTSTQPTVTTTAKYGSEIIYFVSDRPEGKGGMDIWYTIYKPKKKEYSKPRNLGSKINSKADEVTPMFDNESRTLYFSSNGWPGLGGLDVFKSRGERRKWSDPVNVGSPVNTSYDDLYYVLGADQDDGFLVSNRPGGNGLIGPTCCDDLYYFKWTDYIHLAIYGTIYPIRQGQFNLLTGGKKNFSQSDLSASADTIKPLKNAIIAMYMEDPDTKEMILIKRDTTGDDGKYFFKVLPDRNYEFQMEGFQYFNEEMHLSTDFITFSDTFEMPAIWVNILSDKPIVLENIYYEFDKSELTKPAKNVLDTTLLELLKNAKNIVVEVSAHTDSVGNVEYNKKLSQERAENVAAYLVSKGITKERLIPRGYGSEKPVANNFNPDGSDNPVGREKNRRTEFRIVGTLSSVYADEPEDTDEDE